MGRYGKIKNRDIRTKIATDTSEPMMKAYDLFARAFLTVHCQKTTENLDYEHLVPQGFLYLRFCGMPITRLWDRASTWPLPKRVGSRLAMTLSYRYTRVQPKLPVYASTDFLFPKKRFVCTVPSNNILKL